VKHFLTLFAFSIVSVFWLSAQEEPQMSKDSRLAEKYFEQGEYEKAAIHYEKLYNEKNGVAYFYKPYFETLFKLEDYDGLDKMINKAYKASKGDARYLIDLGFVYTKKGDAKLAAKYYQDVITQLTPQQFIILSLARQFLNYGEFKMAEATYLKGREVLQDPSLFNFELAFVYVSLSDYPKMVDAYVTELLYRPDRVKSVEVALQRYLEREQYHLLETVLLKQVQKQPNAIVFQEMLIWMYMNMDDFESAYIQARSTDIRYNEDGFRVMELARTATQQEEFDIAIKAYQYLIDKGPAQSNFVTANLELINVKRAKLVKTPYFKEADLKSLQQSYIQFIESYNQEYTTEYAIIELASLEAFYLHDIDRAISLLDNLLKNPRLNKELEARAKTNLGDYYLLRGEHWESVLLYGQVEKAFRGSPMAEEAKLKNARLSYYKGDFEWAKTQLDILKSSTSELISNNAIDLSVFIADNLNLDTTDHTMMLFARAELMIYQNKFEEANYELDGILKLYPFHSLTDDVYYKKAEIAMKEQDYTAAADWLNKIVTTHKKDLLADNALYLLGKIYQNYLKDEVKAKAAYEQLILDYQGSTFVVDARKQFRKLRGDELN
jgi:tetratricopeptide (TPR) repeat protein